MNVSECVCVCVCVCVCCYKYFTICSYCIQSCSKAWEYYGFVSEKDQAYKDAAFYYDKAWKHSNFSSPALGKCILRLFGGVKGRNLRGGGEGCKLFFLEESFTNVTGYEKRDHLAFFIKIEFLA